MPAQHQPSLELPDVLTPSAGTRRFPGTRDASSEKQFLSQEIPGERLTSAKPS